MKADVTVTFAYEKAGLLFYPGASCAGKVRTADIGIYRLPQNDFELSIQSCEEKDLCRIPARKPDGNKGTSGKYSCSRQPGYKRRGISLRLCGS